MENKDLMTLDFNRAEVVKTLKATVASGLTDAEFLLFAEHCKGTGLNPFKREVWAIKVSGKLQLMTGIGGYFTIANRHPKFDGYEEGYVGKDGQELPDTYSGNDFIGAWCKVYRKDRKMPAKGVAFNAEYKKNYGNWQSMPRVMILKCAESIALRKAFPQELNGTYTAEEMPKEFEVKDEPITVDSEVITTAEAPQSEGMTPQDHVKAREWENVKNTWSGEAIVNFGKHKGKKWSELSGDYIEWLFQNAKGDFPVMAGFEIHRREEAEQSVFEDINNQAARVSEDFDNDPLPEFNLKGE